ncbi:MAG: hypothetical protein PHD36_00205 [Desulfotomaculaceae bacterium]|nr:hypothetical protein [Desulfotomaculaceae bacterium]
MRKYFSLVLLLVFVSCLLLTGCGSSKKETAGNNAQTYSDEPLTELFARGENIEGISFDYHVTSQDLTTNGKMWIDGERIKNESSVEGKQIVSIIDGNTYFTYSPDENMAMKMVLDQQKNETSQNPFDYGKDVDTSPDKYKVLDRTVYDGVMCKVVAVTGADGKENLKMWVREDYGFPIRLEIVEADAGKVVIEYKNIKIEKQPVEIFQLPAGVNITDASDMLKGLSDLPGIGQ